MKKLLPILCILLAAQMHAQPTITGATNNPVPGDRFKLRDCNTAGISAGAAGASVTWDFSGLVTAYTDSISFEACSTTPYCDSFPGATLSVTFDGSYFDYLRTDTNQFAALGSYDGLTIDRFDDPYAISMYPMTYGTIKVDTIIEHLDTIFYAWGIDSFVADGYGTLKLPSGTYDSVLRVHIISYEKDSDIEAGVSTVSYYRTETYNWYRPGFRFILLSEYFDTSGAGSSYLSDVWYCPYVLPAPPALIGEQSVSPTLSIYPNPANDVFMIRLNSDAAQRALIRITDLAGRTVIPQTKHELVAGDNCIPYTSSALKPGSYLVHVQTEGSSFVKRVVIER